MKNLSGGVTAPKGYKAAGVACGLKKNGNKDLAMVVSDNIATVAGVFTKNLVKGHSLQLTMNNIKCNAAKGVVVNSGCANACVGSQGYEDAKLMAQHAANLLNVDSGKMLLGSTGVIGKKLDLDAITKGIDMAYSQLSYKGGLSAEEAIMTTDTIPKEYAVEFNLEGVAIRIGGMAKGSGMIHPDMATMIGIITTDAAISPEMLTLALKTVVNKTFNRVSVDGDTSVCDMVITMANGIAGNALINKEDKSFELFIEGLNIVSEALSKMLAKDGEGATKLVEIVVKNSSTKEQAYKIANSVAKSSLIKTAMFGEDANWGRILTAAGYSGAIFDPDKTDIYIGDLIVCQNGTALPFDEEYALKILKSNEIIVVIDLKSGDCFDRMWTCDFSYDYIKINGSYRT